MATKLSGDPAQFSRRSLLQAAAGAAAILGAATAPASAQLKVSKPSVAYQDQPDGDKRCDRCAHFTRPSACQIVQGPISPQGYCRLFAAASQQG